MLYEQKSFRYAPFMGCRQKNQYTRATGKRLSRQTHEYNEQICTYYRECAIKTTEVTFAFIVTQNQIQHCTSLH